MAEAESEPRKRSRAKSHQMDIFPQDVEAYTIAGLVGKGAFASVYKAYCTTKDADVAIKVIELETNDRDIFETVAAETQTMLTLCHENILPLYACFIYKNEAWAILPFLVATCSEVLKNFDVGLEEKYVSRIVKDVTCGLEYLHKQSLVHADLKSHNILINKFGVSKIADFGVTSSLISIGAEFEKLHQISGTVHWMAPEVAKSLTKDSEGYDSKADIWSLGITCLELAAGKPPHHGLSRHQAMLAILTKEPSTVDDHIKHRSCTAAFKKFVSMCLQTDPKDRKPASELKSAKFLDKPMQYSDFADFLQLNVQDNPYSRKLDENAKPKSLVPPQPKHSKSESWNFTADSATQDEIAEIAEMVVQLEKATEVGLNLDLRKPASLEENDQTGGAGNEKGKISETGKAKSDKSKNCIIS